MNRYKLIKGLVKSGLVAAPVLLFAGVETACWNSVSNKSAKVDNIRDNFAQTEIFQALKSEEDAKLADMKNDLKIAQEQQSKGELETQTYLDMKYEYDQRYAYVNSDDYVLSAMKKYGNGVYTDYKAADNDWNAAFSLGMFSTLLGLPLTWGVERCIVCDILSDEIDCYFDEKIEAYDEKKRTSTQKDIEKAK